MDQVHRTVRWTCATYAGTPLGKTLVDSVTCALAGTRTAEVKRAKTDNTELVVNFMVVVSA